VTGLAVILDAALILAERNLTRPELLSDAVHRFDEPAPRERHNPLRRRVLVPCADLADGLHGEQHGHAVVVLRPLPRQLFEALGPSEASASNRLLTTTSLVFGGTDFPSLAPSQLRSR